MKRNEAKAQEAKDTMLAATTESLTPYTGKSAGKITRAPGLFGSALEGGLQGYQLGKGIERSGLEDEFIKQKMLKNELAGGVDYISRNRSPLLYDNAYAGLRSSNMA